MPGLFVTASIRSVPTPSLKAPAGMTIMSGQKSLPGALGAHSLKALFGSGLSERSASAVST